MAIRNLLLSVPHSPLPLIGRHGSSCPGLLPPSLQNLNLLRLPYPQFGLLLFHALFYLCSSLRSPSPPCVTSCPCLADLAEMGRRRGLDNNGLRDKAGSETTNETYIYISTDDEIDTNRGHATDLTDPEIDEVEGRCGMKHEVEDTDEESYEDTDDDVSSCSDGDNYKANTTALIDRIEGRWQR
jgi:hypothetical protein